MHILTHAHAHPSCLCVSATTDRPPTHMHPFPVSSCMMPLLLAPPTSDRAHASIEEKSDEWMAGREPLLVFSSHLRRTLFFLQVLSSLPCSEHPTCFLQVMTSTLTVGRVFFLFFLPAGLSIPLPRFVFSLAPVVGGAGYAQDAGSHANCIYLGDGRSSFPLNFSSLPFPSLLPLSACRNRSRKIEREQTAAAANGRRQFERSNNFQGTPATDIFLAGWTDAQTDI
mmetsp:Transcript_11966/g.22977  ORF Transcript_11966/g.22977 Transcript_11966/m.22977 type:complete len:226 (+) Transcript_11966:322-999(+)